MKAWLSSIREDIKGRDISLSAANHNTNQSQYISYFGRGGFIKNDAF